MHHMEKKSLIRARRRVLRLSTSELAHRLGLSQSTVVRLEKSEDEGAVSLNTLRKAADALGCDFEYRLAPRTKRPGNKSYHGLRKTASISRLGTKLKADERAAAVSMTAEHRLILACELSDLSKELR